MQLGYRVWVGGLGTGVKALRADRFGELQEARPHRSCRLNHHSVFPASSAEMERGVGTTQIVSSVNELLRHGGSIGGW